MWYGIVFRCISSFLKIIINVCVSVVKYVTFVKGYVMFTAE